MLKSFVANSGIIANSINKEIAIVGISIFNENKSDAIATMKLLTSTNEPRATILQTSLEPNETIFLDTKIFLSNGDKLEVDGASFILAGSCKDVV